MRRHAQLVVRSRNVDLGIRRSPVRDGDLSACAIVDASQQAHRGAIPLVLSHSPEVGVSISIDVAVRRLDELGDSISIEIDEVAKDAPVVVEVWRIQDLRKAGRLGSVQRSTAPQSAAAISVAKPCCFARRGGSSRRSQPSHP